MQKVSIIVPVYNSEKYLDTCIKSILQQSYTNWELILINDGSTDASEEICSSFAAANEKIILICQKNRGVSGARNAGLAKASGDYISFVDSDDELEATAIETMLHDIIKYNADMSSAGKSFVSANGHVHCNEDGAIHIYSGEEMMKRSLSYDSRTRSLHAKLFTKKLIRDIRFIEGHNINEDGYFLFECYAKQPKVVQHNVSMYKYYLRDGSASNSRFSEKYFDMLYFADLKMKYIQEFMPDYIDHAKSMMVRTHLLFLQVLCRTTDNKYKDAQRQSIQMVRTLYQYHRPINEHHKKLAWIVTHGLYPLYKLAVRIKYHS